MFDEKKMEWSTKQQKEIPVLISEKYKESKKVAEELIKEKKYGLAEADFWILKNETKTGYMQYTGLIISHNGCLKINDGLTNKINPHLFALDKDGYKRSLIYTYCDEDVYEVGEVNDNNCKNEYPYAMAYKRCFDRVVLKKSKLAYSGIYSDSEAEEFTKKDEPIIEEKELISEHHLNNLKASILKNNLSDYTVFNILKKYGYTKPEEIEKKNLQSIINDFKEVIENV